MTTILIADDERTVREVIRQYLQREGFQVLEAENGTQALSLIYQERPDLLILDIMLPDLDGFTLIRTLRQPVRDSDQAIVDLPVIMLTARTEEDDRVAGFELGADDYVIKPFSPRELVMRVRAVLRRSQITNAPKTETLVQGAICIDIGARSVTREGQVVSLTAKEFDLLVFLARHPNQVFTRTQLMDQVWGYEFYGDESTVTVHVHRLREKLEHDPAKPRYIQTVWGVGYKFEVSS